jgi:hypothetical protein
MNTGAGKKMAVDCAKGHLEKKLVGILKLW